MYKDLDYRPESYASAVNYANRLNSEMESAKSECLGILSGLTPPADLDIGGEVSSLRSIIESMSTRVGEIRTTIEEIRNEIESRDANIASQLEAYINNEKAYVHNTEKDRIVGSKPDPKDYADGVNDEAYIKDLENYELTLAAYEAFSEGKTDYNYLKSTYGEEVATKIQLEYGKQYGSTVGEGKSIVEVIEGAATGVKDAAVLFATNPVEFYKRAGATITNTGAAIIKGGLDLVEGVMDFGTAIGGAIGAGVASWTGHEEASKTISEKTSSFISTDWVDKAYDKIYSTAGGQWLDSKSLLKHDSQVFDTIAGFGKMAGLILISTVASPAVGALVAGASAGGETIEKDFQNLGGSTSDLGEYGQTLLHGTLTGAVEGAMWYGGSKVNLGGDLALSVVDPVARTGVQMISPTENRSFKEIFNEDYGGAKGIITNMAFSILGNKFSDSIGSKKLDLDLSSTKNVDADIIAHRLSDADSVVAFNTTSVAAATAMPSSSSNTALERIKNLFKRNGVSDSSFETFKSKYKYLTLTEENLQKEYMETLGELRRLETRRDILAWKDSIVSDAIDFTAEYHKYDEQAKLALEKLFKNNDIDTILNNNYINRLTRQNGYRDEVLEHLTKVSNAEKSIKDIKSKLEQIDVNLGNCHNQIDYFNKTELPNFVEDLLKKKKLNKVFDKLDDKFEELNFDKQHYGVDQGIGKKNIKYVNDSYGHTYKVGTQEYHRVKQNLMQRYNMTNTAASNLITFMDDKGACSYAAIANQIFARYLGKEEKFLKDFGFDMYTTINGNKTFNGMELMADMYLYQNHTDNFGKLFTNKNGRIVLNESAIPENNFDIFGRQKIDASQQQYMSGVGGINNDLVDYYLKSKNADLKFQSNKIFDAWDHADAFTDLDIENIKSSVAQEILKGKQIQLGIYERGGEIRMQNLNGGFNQSTRTWNEGGGHAVFVTGADESGFIVSSWGEKFRIPFEDLKNGAFVVNSVEITGV